MAPEEGAFKERTFEDFNIDAMTLGPEENERVLDLIDENNTMAQELRDLRSRLAQSAAAARAGGGGGTPTAGGPPAPTAADFAQMEAELARLMAENADLKTGVRSPAQPPPSASKTPQLGSKGLSLGRSASVESTGDVSKLEAQVDGLMAEVSEYIKQINSLEDELEAARSSRPQQNGVAASDPHLAEENAALRRQLAALESRAGGDRVLRKKPSDIEVAESEALVAEIMSLQATIHPESQQDKRETAQTALLTLTESKMQLEADKAAAEAAAAAAKAERERLQAELQSQQEQVAALTEQLQQASSQTKMTPGGKSRLDLKLLDLAEKLKAEKQELVDRNAALSGSVHTLQKQLARTEGAETRSFELQSEVEKLRSQLAELQESKGSRADVNALREAREKTKLTEVELADAKRRVVDALAGRADAQRALDNSAKRAAELEASNQQLEAANQQLEAEVGELTRVAANAAAVAGDQYAAEQTRWTSERKQLKRELAELADRNSQLAEENEALVAKVARLVPRTHSRSSSLDGSPTKSTGLSGGEGTALMRDLAEENEKLVAENKRLTSTAKQLLEENSRLTTQLLEAAGLGDLQGEEESRSTGDVFISPAKLDAQRSEAATRAPSPTRKGRTLIADSTGGDVMSLPGSPAKPARNSGPFAQQRDTSGGKQPPAQSATARLAALAAMEEEAEAAEAAAAAAAASDSADDGGGGFRQPDELLLSPRSPGGVDTAFLRRRQREFAEQVERSQQAAEEDAGRRASLQSRTKQHLAAYDKVKAEALARLQSYASGFGGATPATPNRPPPHPDSSLRRPSSSDRLGSPRHLAASATSSGGTSPASVTPLPPLQRQSSPVTPANNVPGGGFETPPEHLQQRGSVVLDDGEQYWTPTAGTPGEVNLPPVRRRTSSEGSDASDASRRLREEQVAPRRGAEAVEGMRTADRRARQEMEEAARLQRQADDLVRRAYFRFSGNEDVAAFMRALGYDFRSDAAADASQLFRQALQQTHPDRNVAKRPWDRAVAAAAFPKLQEWQSEVQLL